MPIPEHTTLDTPLELARSALVHLQQLTATATNRLEQKMVLPQVEAAMRSQQDGLMAMAQAAAQVSIAESLADISQLLRPEIRIEAKSPGDRVPPKELLEELGDLPGAVARGH